MYNAIPGRYVNRIGNARYTIGDTTYMTETNDGNNTLHSGTNNWSYRVWNVVAVSADSITFSIVDKEGDSTGMPGRVDANVTYTVANGTWYTTMAATASAKTRELFPPLNPQPPSKPRAHTGISCRHPDRLVKS